MIRLIILSRQARWLSLCLLIVLPFKSMEQIVVVGTCTVNGPMLQMLEVWQRIVESYFSVQINELYIQRWTLFRFGVAGSWDWCEGISWAKLGDFLPRCLSYYVEHRLTMAFHAVLKCWYFLFTNLLVFYSWCHFIVIWLFFQNNCGFWNWLDWWDLLTLSLEDDRQLCRLVFFLLSVQLSQDLPHSLEHGNVRA